MYEFIYFLSCIIFHILHLAGNFIINHNCRFYDHLKNNWSIESREIHIYVKCDVHLKKSILFLHQQLYHSKKGQFFLFNEYAFDSFCAAFLQFVDGVIFSICLKVPSPLECKYTSLKAAANFGYTLDLYG